MNDTDRPITIDELEPGRCKWPVGPSLYCGCMTPKRGAPYCARHQEEGTKPLQPRARPYVKKSYRQ